MGSKKRPPRMAGGSAAALSCSGAPMEGWSPPEAIPEETGENPDLEASDALGCERQRG